MHPDEADVKNNDRFGFRILKNISKNIEIDIPIILIENIEFHPPFGAQFQPPDGSDMKNNGRFRFGIPKNIEIDI